MVRMQSSSEQASWAACCCERLQPPPAGSDPSPAPPACLPVACPQYYWNPTREDRVGVCMGIFQHDNVDRTDVERVRSGPGTPGVVVSQLHQGRQGQRHACRPAGCWRLVVHWNEAAARRAPRAAPCPTLLLTASPRLQHPLVPRSWWTPSPASPLISSARCVPACTTTRYASTRSAAAAASRITSCQGRCRGSRLLLPPLVLLPLLQLLLP